MTIISYEQPTSRSASTMASNVPITFFSSFLHGTQIVRSNEFSRIGSTGVASFGRGCSSDFIIVSWCSRDLPPNTVLFGQGKGHETINVGRYLVETNPHFLGHGCRQRNYNPASSRNIFGRQNLTSHECSPKPAGIFIKKARSGT